MFAITYDLSCEGQKWKFTLHIEKNVFNIAVDGSFDVNEFRMDESSMESEGNEQDVEQVNQKISLDTINKDYKIFTEKCDEVEKAEKVWNVGFSKALNMF